MSAGALRGVLVGVCSALVTGAAHAAGGGSVSGATLVVLALLCGTVGAGTSAVRAEGPMVGILIPAIALGAAQVMGHVVLTLAAHHTGHAGATTAAMLVAHLVGTVALAALIGIVEFLYRSAGSVLCWLRPVAIHRGRPRAAAFRARAVIVARPVLLRSGTGMRAPPLRHAVSH
ncbi:hypothetical protein BVC93_25730 [Mycobacterium sp. MS1601]|nr:hypothetical protein BVC93_25730 [Mycobacterium sp. MS1601]